MANEIAPLGDAALLLRVCGNDRLAAAPAETLREVLALLQQLKSGNIPGVTEIVPAYTTLAIFFDPLAVIRAGAAPDHVFDWLAERIRARAPCRAQTRGCSPAGGQTPVHYEDAAGVLAGRLVEIPVCYGGEFGPDLEEIARRTRLSPEEIIRRHSAAEYRVHCLGFTPGFPYLSGLPPELAVPRRSTPRREVPAGAVGIGGRQTGIYPRRSPGGWHLLGRTPRRMFAVERDPPALLRPGDEVRFRAISREEFEAWQE